MILKETKTTTALTELSVKSHKYFHITTETITKTKKMKVFFTKSGTGAIKLDLFTGAQVFPFTVGLVELINNKINPKVEL